ncbi:MAG TPA: FAD-dependent oxidoreductase [Polyangiaceae bacterium]|jgi:phytoene dehydrogenase-like protein|nr:FAD-dependent oxidoreductase [Polyangiaceae bacterium]
MNDVIIVGGGLAGLTAATLCARRGLSAVLLERAGALGGRAQTTLERGHAHNLGGHALYRGGAIEAALRELGVPFTGAPPPTGGLLAMARGQLHRFPAGPFSMLATDLLGFKAKIEAARAFRALVKVDAAALRDVPWGAWLAEAAPREEVRHALEAIGRVATYANAPSRMSAGATIAQIRRAMSPGVLYLDGGWQTLVDGLEKAARGAGVRIVRDATVSSMVHGEPNDAAPARHEAVLKSGERVAGRAVVLATGPQTARSLAGPGAAPFSAGLLPSHAACLDVGLASLPRPERLVVFGLDRATYFSVHSASARLAERGATIHLMKYLDPEEGGDGAAAAERELEDLADRVQPGWRAVTVTRRFLPNLVSSNATVLAGARRPAVDAAGVAGVYLAGDWVGETGMLGDTVMASARAAAEAVIGTLGVTDQRAAS